LRDPFARADGDELGRVLRERSRDELLGFSKQLGLTGVTKLGKEALAGRVAEALEAGRGSASVEDLPGEGPDTPTGSLAAKFDLGPGADADEVLPRSIPWGYGFDRVTAMAVDPARLFVYWEVTDDAIEAARRQLGGGGEGAWINVRVYDISGRLFDGTNAHSYFDHGVGRDIRQWFFEIGKPTSTACVEVGMKSSEGFFVKIARSGRVDFARDHAQGASAVEWLTVRTATGWAGEPIVGGAPRPDGYGALGGGSGQDWQGWNEGAGFPVPGATGRGGEGGVEWTETTTEHVRHEIGHHEWVGPVYRSEWQAGPFSYPIDVPSMLELHESGEVSMRTEDGIVHVNYGPWQVVIRGTNARAERRVLATWEYRRSVEVPGGYERDETIAGTWEPVAPGSSALRLVGASERRWQGASELLGRGGSEVWLMGASERLFRGASERLFRGASERLFRGASERLLRGASERLLGGASERTFAGAGGFPGASERRLGGSENASSRGANTPANGVAHGGAGGVWPYPSSEG
jgi:hypothetical protein